MKKKILGIAVVAAIALAAGWNYNQSKNETKLNDLALANVEALAGGEEWATFRVVVHDLHSWTCYNGGVSYCPL